VAQSPAYRVPRRFITHPHEPAPYGLVALSFTAHVLLLAGSLAVSAFLSSRIDQSKVYIVNLVPAAPAVGSPAGREARPAPAPPPKLEPPPRIAERTPPKPEPPPPPKVAERTPPKPEPAPAPPAPKPVEPPPRPDRPLEPPPVPRASDLARAVAPLRPSELALPRRAEKETPTIEPAASRIERALPRAPSVTPPAPPRLPDVPRVPAPPQAPIAPPATGTSVVSKTGPVEPIRLGRPTPGPTTTGSISLDVGDFPFTYYLRQIQAKISERWAPPRAAAAGGERTIVLFEIGRDGQIREPVLERSSGNTLYDQSALRAVLEASPFPPLPPEFKASSLRVHFGFDYQPDQG
jgi:TonB family protein